MSKLRETAEDILVYERVVLKRWLREHGGLSSGFDQRYRDRDRDVEYLAVMVRDRGGDPELLRSRGREWGVKALCEKHGCD